MARALPSDPPNCETCTSRCHSVFSDLVPFEISTISSAKGCRNFSKGELIFYADAIPTGVYCVHHGTVKVYKVGRDGKEQTIRLAQRGDIIGYRSLISGDSYQTFAVPIVDAQLCHIPKDTFLDLTRKSATLSVRLMRLLADELRLAENKMVEMVQKSLRERLAETLLALKSTYGLQADQTTLGIKLTRIELANIVGTAPESVSRALSKLKEERIIDTLGRSIRILNHRALVSAASLQD